MQAKANASVSVDLATPPRQGTRARNLAPNRNRIRPLPRPMDDIGPVELPDLMLQPDMGTDLSPLQPLERDPLRRRRGRMSSKASSNVRKGLGLCSTSIAVRFPPNLFFVFFWDGPRTQSSGGVRVGRQDGAAGAGPRLQHGADPPAAEQDRGVAGGEGRPAAGDSETAGRERAPAPGDLGGLFAVLCVRGPRIDRQLGKHPRVKDIGSRPLVIENPLHLLLHELLPFPGQLVQHLVLLLHLGEPTQSRCFLCSQRQNGCCRECSPEDRDTRISFSGQLGP